MENSHAEPSSQLPVSRREFIKRTAVAAALPVLSGTAASQDQAEPSSPKKARPNIIVYIADQFRWDCVSAYGLNPMQVTPNLDGVAARGVAFQNAVTNQPLCSPSRACLFTGMYATQTGVWTLTNLDVGLKPDAVTLATILRSEGYTANYIGKWHLAPSSHAQPNTLGFVPRQHRGGFLDLWEGANELELTSHPYHGTIWNGDGEAMQFQDVYRVDYLTQRAVKFLQQKQERPFLLVVSQLEPHFQNDLNAFAPPKGYRERYVNPFVPQDLKFFPGDWDEQLPNYYGDIKSIDDSVGTVLKTLDEQGLTDNTIFLFISDHGCHFRTRNEEYKRSPHESSIHIPLLVQGPGFNQSRMVRELVSMIDVTPTLLDAAGVKVPSSIMGRSLLPLLNNPAARKAWPQEAFIQISQSMVARALRTDQWTYCVADPTLTGEHPYSKNYVEYQMYNLTSDPHQLLNLAGRRDVPKLVHDFGERVDMDIADHLRERLLALMAEAGDPPATIEKRRLYP
ncbi:MAG TPA: sulfatase-like hydrolase/transferase [Terracidiphilus sp.]|nr:sulfatase-like hydrolase/transferase [Terracidiphilus sp.]